ncbi:hypothetical protein HK102_012094, partial [Quaeritorhiza haematococci]
FRFGLVESSEDSVPEIHVVNVECHDGALWAGEKTERVVGEGERFEGLEGEAGPSLFQGEVFLTEPDWEDDEVARE